MSFKNLNIKACYESGTDDIIEDFYNPVLSNSISYDRIAGFFSSSSLAIAARGLYGFIKNNGKMRLVTSPILNSEDVSIIDKCINNPEALTEYDLKFQLDNIENEFVKNHVKALGWMLQKHLLEMKLAIVIGKNYSPSTVEELRTDGLFHQKVGILKDSEGNEISFSGSINESASAWVNNDEEFKVFNNWTYTKEYFDKDKNRFGEIWSGSRKNIRVFELPEAIKHHIIEYSNNFNIENISINNYRKYRQNRNVSMIKQISLFDYQRQALEEWKENKCRLLFEMATGTGKTRTAIAGINYLNEASNKFFVVVSTPQNTLSKQWQGEVNNLKLDFDRNAIIDGSIPDWKKELTKILLDNSNGIANHCIIFTTHATASSDNFISIIKNELSTETITLFIGDEVHWLGASKYRKALLNQYNFRIGLSATPTRWFDEDGTNILEQYFGNKKFEFSIHDALINVNPLTGKHFLVNYYYNIYKVSLNEEETIEYKKITKRLIQLSSDKDRDPEIAEKYERLLEKRANIIKNAEAKYSILQNILDILREKNDLSNIIIFVSPQQIENVMQILIEKKIAFHRLTEAEGTRRDKRYLGMSQREFIISKFKSKEYQVLVAIKCLDEGIDIPTADIGILMSSSSNPREYVQRIGRIIRQAENKKFAKLYDICIDKVSGLDTEELELERKIREKECIRLTDIAKNSINPVDALNIITSIKY